MINNTSSIDLSKEQLHLVRELLREHIPHVEVWAYGSRVKLTSTPKSDLDMVAHVGKEEKEKIYALREAFDESSLPYRVDFFVWDELSVEFHAQIEKAYYVVQKKKHSSNFPSRQWKKYKIADICDINKNTYSFKDKWKFVNYLDTGSITQNTIEAIQYIDLSTEKLPSRAKRKVSNESIIYSTVRPNQLHYGFLEKQPENFLVSTGFAVLEISSHLADAKFIYYCLIRNEVTKHFQSLAEQGACAYPTLKPSIIGDFELSLPSLQTQKQIAHVLSTIDKKIELNQRINENLEQQAQAIFKSWFVDFEPFGGVMPSDWLPMAFENISTVQNGFAFKSKDYTTNGCKMIRTTDIVNNYIDDTNLINLPQEFYEKEKYRKFIFENLDTVLVMVGASLGKIGLVTEKNLPALQNQNMWRFRAKNKNVPPAFIYYSVKHVNESVKKCSSGSARDFYRKDLFKKAICNFPNKDSMKQFHSIASPIFSTISKILLENHNLYALRDTLLPKLMSGEIDVSQVKI